MVDRTTRPIVPVVHDNEREHRRLLAVRTNASMPKDGTEAMVAPMRLWRAPFASFPDADDWIGALAWDEDADRLMIATGDGWQTVLIGADYEEGTWTPSLKFGGANTGWVFSGASGIFTRIGLMTVASFRLVVDTVGSATGDAVIFDLPFTPQMDQVGSVEINEGFEPSLTGDTHLILPQGENVAAIRQGGTGNAEPVDDSAFIVDTEVRGTMAFQLED